MGIVALVLIALVAQATPTAPVVAQGSIGGCNTFPPNSIFNTPVDALPVHPRSSDYVNSIGLNTTLHADFGTVYNGAPNGIPYTTVVGTQAQLLVAFRYADESDPGPYPIPNNPPIEGGPNSDGDRHVLIVDTTNCKLYELFHTFPPNASNNAWCVSGQWCASSGAIWDLNSHALRPDTWTSADAAGLPMLPILVRYDEVAAGEIKHALRFAADITQRAYVWPGRHFASSNTSPTRPPMAQRFRLKAAVNVEAMNIAPEAKVIFRALQKYGMFLADNGGNWYIHGVPDPRWDDAELRRAFDMLHGRDFEAVDSSSLMIDKDSGEARQAQPVPTPTATIASTPFVPNHWVYLPVILK
jgi:hypothetical protein